MSLELSLQEAPPDRPGQPGLDAIRDDLLVLCPVVAPALDDQPDWACLNLDLAHPAQPLVHAENLYRPCRAEIPSLDYPQTLCAGPSACLHYPSREDRYFRPLSLVPACSMALRLEDLHLCGNLRRFCRLETLVSNYLSSACVAS